MTVRINLRAFTTALAISAAAMALTSVTQAEPAAPFAEFDATSTATVDTGPYAEFMSVLTLEDKGRTLVGYDVVRAQASEFMQGYAAYLSNVPVSALNRDEQLAYWLNTRNFLVVKTLSEDARLRSLKAKRGTPDAPGELWTKSVITVSGVALSLHEIEQNIILAGWDDPNLIFGLYQGLEGGPALPRTPFSGANVSDQLAALGAAYASDKTHVKPGKKSLRVSTYFDWYAASLYEGERDLVSHVASFLPEAGRAQALSAGKLNRKKLSTSFEQYRARQSAGTTRSGSNGAGFDDSVNRGPGLGS